MSRSSYHDKREKKEPAQLFHTWDSTSKVSKLDDSKPLVRWWWLSGPFTQADILGQLEWVYAHGFGGVELAWLLPRWLAEDEAGGGRPAWMSTEWRELVRYTKARADEMNLRCDFTLGSSWPFGGSWLAIDDAAQTFEGLSRQRLRGTWETETEGGSQIVNHLSESALRHYAGPLLDALRDALQGGTSSLFCDSLELETEGMWDSDLWGAFERRFGYSLRPYISSLSRHPGVRYDYRKILAETMQREFFDAFTSLCHEHGAASRVQCHGAPVDLLGAYASVDIPESESLLFPPAFSRIAASAAAWAAKPVVSAESFTCLYGFPGWDETAEELWKLEDIGDLKLLADALFANGVNQIVWHGMPYQPANKTIEFYASVHVGPDCHFTDHLAEMNGYLARVSTLLRLGKTKGGVGVYLPWEDALMKDRLPSGQRTPGANYVWEMRHANAPAELDGFHPLWISEPFLREATVCDGVIRSRDLELPALYVDCRWMDIASLREFERLANAGARLIWKRRCRQPGQRRNREYRSLQRSVMDRAHPTVAESALTPLVGGESLPLFWARQVESDLLIFFAHPRAKLISYPMPHRFSAASEAVQKDVVVHWNGHALETRLAFQPNAAILLHVSARGGVEELAHNGARQAPRKA